MEDQRDDIKMAFFSNKESLEEADLNKTESYACPCF